MATSRTRSDRSRELVAATRALFDERGRQTAQIEEIARSVGIARGLVYREFASKEELYTLTVTDYLREVLRLLDEVDDDEAAPRERLRASVEVYARYCLRYPAYIDATLSLMQTSAAELRSGISDAVWFRLVRDMIACLDHLSAILRAGCEQGEFVVDDPDYTAHVIWTQILGVMHLPRLTVGVRRGEAGAPEPFAIDPDGVILTCVASALAVVGA